ncbi:hypothetical protein [Flavobacterium sp. ASW18X]|uniref:hypothetical protein n=1 Tax=Flavobacterium sp. ASW18X TaxID=2572595 RepID=UPI0010AEEA7F|nr:hypothetical protein [Flavobacterium sp. ASW18X]TKD67026.1 hypothetical protein FBT53_00940 [Flavobacterium sp. ASW18X]
MKKLSCYIAIFLLGTPIGLMAQQEATTKEVNFYTHLAVKDANNEHQLSYNKLEDEQDFWSDQKSYEAILEKQRPDLYAVYMRQKRTEYLAHQKYCEDNACDHTELYLKQASIYILHDTKGSELVAQ